MLAVEGEVNMTTNGTQRMHCKMIDFSALRVAGRNRELMEDSCGAIIIPFIAKPYDRRPRFDPARPVPRKHPHPLDDWTED